MPRFKLVIEYAGTRYSGWQIQKNARTVQGEIDRAIREVAGATRVRALRRRAAPTPACTRSRRSRISKLYTTLPPESLQPPHQRRAAGRHPHPDDRQGATSLPRAPRRRVAQLPLPDLAAPDRVRASRSCGGSGSRSIWTPCGAPRRRSWACTTSTPSPTTTPTRSPRSSSSSTGARGGRRPRSHSRPGLALPVEDGAPHGRRARGRRTRRR